MLVGTPFEALPLGKVRTGQRLIVLNGDVIAIKQDCSLSGALETSDQS
jgi:hypothetical protein